MSTDPVLDRELSDMIDKIVKGYAPKKVILFGSRARGNATQESDIDLCVIKNGIEQESNRSYELRRLLRGAAHPLDLLVYSEAEITQRLNEEDPFLKDVVQNGKVLYQQA